jgi:hypothetical protein
MAVVKDARSPYFRFDLQIDGHRFFGSTKQTTKREAEAVERVEREKAKRHLAHVRASAGSVRLDDVAGRYWSEVGQHHAGARNTERQIGYLIDFFGKDKLLTDITGDDVARLVAWRRGHRARPSKDAPLISAYTVNDTTEQLKRLFVRAKAWGVIFDREPEWRRYWLAEPQERVRELVGDEGERLEEATREDYAPFFAFVRASGLRQRECLLKCPRSIGARDRFGKPVRAADWSLCRSRRRSAKSSGHFRGTIPSTCSPTWPNAPATAACTASAIR